MSFETAVPYYQDNAVLNLTSGAPSTARSAITEPGRYKMSVRTRADGTSVGTTSQQHRIEISHSGGVQINREYGYPTSQDANINFFEANYTFEFTITEEMSAGIIVEYTAITSRVYNVHINVERVG